MGDEIKVLVVDSENDRALAPIIAAFLSSARLRTCKILAESAGSNQSSKGSKPTEAAIYAMRTFGFDISNHVATWIGNVELNRYSTIICTDKLTVEYIKREAARGSVDVQVINFNEPNNMAALENKDKNQLVEWSQCIRERVTEMIIKKEIRGLETEASKAS